MPITVPLLNGNRYEYASVRLTFNGFVFTGVKSFNYKQSKKRGKAYGTSVVKIGRTRGQLEMTGSAEFYKEEYNAFLTQLIAAGLGVRGYMDVEFQAVISYEEIQNGIPTLITDELDSLVLDEEEDDHSEGTDPLSVKCGLDGFWVKRNGLPPVIEVPVPL